MTTNYISENQSPSEVFRQFGDQVPEFMQSWLEDLVNKVQDAKEIYNIIYNNSDLDVDSPEFEGYFIEMVDQSAEYDGLKGEIIDLENRVEDLEKENKEYMKLLNDNGIDY